MFYGNPNHRQTHFINIHYKVMYILKKTIKNELTFNISLPNFFNLSTSYFSSFDGSSGT